MENSLWLSNTELPHFQKLSGDLKTDILIIGGGICGILCGYFLKQAGINCVIVESDKIAHGVTSGTTAKITSLHGLIYQRIIAETGREKATKYLQINQYAIKKYEEICKYFDCEFKKTFACTYSTNNISKIINEVKSLNSLGFPAVLKEDLPLPIQTVGAVFMSEQAQFNPLKFIKNIVKGLTIYENTPIRQLSNTHAIYDNGKITAKKVIVTTHFPFINTHGSYFLKLYQHRSYVLAIENAQHIDGMYIDEAENGLSFRNSGKLMLLGGGGQRTGKKCKNWGELEEIRNRYYPKSNIKYKWATQDCMSLDGLPYIGKYSARTPDLFVATGFNKWGMTLSMVSAMVLCDLVQGKKNEYAEIFSPSRNIIKPQLFINGFDTITNFLRPTPKRCSHMGCALKWNKAEHTWDCPCHGSRFDEDGQLLNNPAQKNLE